MGQMLHARRALGTLTLVALAALLEVGPPADAQSGTDVIPVGQHPFHVGVNPATNRVYVSNQGGIQGDGTVSVIDGATNVVIATIPVGPIAEDVAANPVTNRIYAASFLGSLAVIDGASNTVIATVPVGAPFGGPLGVAVNPTTNRIYLRRMESVSVLDGATNTIVATIPVEGGSRGVAVDPATNRIYVSNLTDNTVAVIDGASHTVIGTIPVAENPGGVDVNPATNRVYVAVGDAGLAVIDGASRAVVATIPIGAFALAVAFNPATNRVYVRTDEFSLLGRVAVVDATSNTVVDTLPIGDDRATGADVAVNPGTNRVYIPLAGYDLVWATEDPPRVGGTRFGITARPEGVLLSWSAGTVATGYSIVRWGAESGTVDMLPRGGPLPAGTTSFMDVEPLPEAAYLYAVLPRNASGILWMSDLLGLQPNTQAGAGAPQEFTLRHHTQSIAGSVVTMTWQAPGGQTGYVLFAMDSEAVRERSVFREDVTSTVDLVGWPQCFMLFAAIGELPIGNTHSLCAAPLASMMEGP